MLVHGGRRCEGHSGAQELYIRPTGAGAGTGHGRRWSDVIVHGLHHPQEAHRPRVKPRTSQALTQPQEQVPRTRCE